MKHYWLLFLLAGLSFGQPSSPQSAREAYDYVNGRRGEARKLFARGDTDGIDKGVQVLKEALLYLDRPLIRDLASGYRYLESRRVNIYIDLAEAQGLQGKDRECLEYLRQCLVLAPDQSSESRAAAAPASPWSSHCRAADRLGFARRGIRSRMGASGKVSAFSPTFWCVRQWRTCWPDAMQYSSARSSI